MTPYQVNRAILWALQQQAQRRQQQAQQGQQAPGGGFGSLFGGGAGGAGGSSLFGGGSGGATYGGLSGSTPVASSMGGGEILADGSIAGEGSLAGAASVALPIAAVVGGAYQANRARKAFQNGNANVAGIAGSLAGGVGIGLPLAGATKLFGGHTPAKKMESNRINKLKEQGINVAGSDPNAAPLPENAAFKTSRDESKLRPEDTWGAAANYETFGNDYLGKSSEAQRRAFQQQAIDQGLWREHKGTLDFTDAEKAKKLWDQTINGSIPKAGDQPQKTIQFQGNDLVATLPPAMIPKRSMTRSPGIDKNGNRIRY